MAELGVHLAQVFSPVWFGKLWDRRAVIFRNSLSHSRSWTRRVGLYPTSTHMRKRSRD